MLGAAAGQQSTTVVVTAPAVVVGQQYGNNPCRTTCPHCQANIVTSIDHQVGGLAWMICGIILLVGIIFPYVRNDFLSLRQITLFTSFIL